MADPAPMPEPFSWQRGTVVVHLQDDQREALGIVVGAYRHALTDSSFDGVLWRLRPPAHPDDPEAEAAYRELVDHDLAAQRLGDLQAFEETLDSAQLDEAALAAWTRTLSGCRLMMASRSDIDVTDLPPPAEMDADDPRMEALAVFDWVGYLLEGLIEAAQQGLDENSGRL